jgi:hypothetical protein
LLCLRDLRRPPINAGGAVVLASATTQGVGAHGLFSPGGLSYRAPRRLKSLGNDNLLLYTPNVSNEQVSAHFWPEYGVAGDSPTLVTALSRFVPASGSVGVVPCGPLQQLTDCRRD